MPKNGSLKYLGNIKLIIAISYLVLITLAIYGVKLIYRELVNFSEYDRPFEERKELALISNTLATLYEAESMSKIMYMDTIPDTLRCQYNNLVQKVFSQIDTLYDFSKDSSLQSHLDTVKSLLNQRERNQESMFLLLNSIRKLSYTQKVYTTVLSKKDMSYLDKMFKSYLEINKDTTVVKSNKKNFFSRLRSVFKPDQDSLVFVSLGETQKVDSAYLDPVALLTDTVVQYVNNVVYNSDKKKYIYMSQLALRQNEMYRNNEQLTMQINKILRDIEAKELEIVFDLLKEKDRTVNRSSRIVARIALASLFAAIIFLILSLGSISRSQKYRRQIEKGKKYVEDLLRSRERLLLTISHDIKAPLSSIIGYIELLVKSKLPEKEKYYLQSMQSSSEHVLELVNKLLDYHRLEQGKQELNKMSFSPCRLMDDICQSFLPIASQKGLKFEWISDLLPRKFYESDPFVIRQILNNVISNAIKFTFEGGVVIRTSIVSKSEKDLLCVSVKDTGTGISKEDKDTIFEEFRRLDNTKQIRIEGSGLGLAITKKLIQLLNGTIEFESIYGKGTEFILSIPLLPSQNTPVQKEESNHLNKIKSAKILFVDDDIVILNVYMKLLQREGFEVSICKNSMDVLSVLRKNCFDIIFTDIQMPGMNGFELVEKIRVSGLPGTKDIPVIALSARSDISEQKFKEAGFTGFLAKPFSSELLLDIIDNFVQHEEISSRSEKQENISTKGIHSLIEFVEDDKEASLDILKVFITENENTIKGLEDSLKNENWESIRKYAHKLLPLMHMIGANEILSILLEFEDGLQDLSKVNELIAMIEQKNVEATFFMRDKFN